MIYGAKTKDLSGAILLIGIKTFIVSHKGQIMINPKNYNIRKGDYGVILAQSSEMANFVNDFASQIDIMASDKYSFGILKKEYRYLEESPIDAIIKSQNDTLKSEFKSKNSLSKKLHYKLFIDDLRNRLRDHIIVFGPYSHFRNSLKFIRKRSQKTICYMADKLSDMKNWQKLDRQYSNIYFLEGDIFDVKHLKKAAIEKAYHVLIYSHLTKSSINSDSNT